MEDFSNASNSSKAEAVASISSVRVTISTQGEEGNEDDIQDPLQNGDEVDEIEEEGDTLDNSSIVANQGNCGKEASFTPSATIGNTNCSYDLNTIPAEPQCYLILPTHLQSSCHGTSCNDFRRTSNECAICMIEYDVGDVVIYSKNCRHAFHQDCILDWFSREKTQCPSCREVFWDPKGEAGGKKSAAGSSNAGGTSGGAQGEGTHDGNTSASGATEPNFGNRARISTEDTEVLSILGESQSFDAEASNIGNGSSNRSNSTDLALEPVDETRAETTEGIPAVSVVAA